MATHSFQPISTRNLLILISILCISFSSLYAQDDQPLNNKKEGETKMHVKIITKDKDGKIKKIDTLYRYGGAVDDSVIVRYLHPSKDMKEFADQMKEMQITLDMDLDSLDSLAKEITATVFMDDGQLKGEFSPENFSWEEGDHDPELIPDRNEGPWGQPMGGHKKMFCYPGNDIGMNWMQGNTPWGKISEIKVKNKRHGKKIVIRTHDHDSFGYFEIPPVPPAPPCPIPENPRKKIIIKKHIETEK
jgi:hypothetical protein